MPPDTRKISILHSERGYRSRKSRPCDRCRRRKLRCIIPDIHADCINCQIASSGCTFDDPPTKRPPKQPKPNTNNNSNNSNNNNNSDNKNNANTATNTVNNNSNNTNANNNNNTSTPPAPSGPTCVQPANAPNAPTPNIPLASPTLSNSLSPTTSQAGSIPRPLTRIFTRLVPLTESTTFSNSSNSGAPVAFSSSGQFMSYYGPTSESDTVVYGMLANQDDLNQQSASSDPKKPRLSRIGNHHGKSIYFVQHDHNETYSGPTDAEAKSMATIEELVGPENVRGILESYFAYDGRAVPIWSEEQLNLYSELPIILRSSFLGSGLVYKPEQRHLHYQVWFNIYQTFPKTLCMSHFTTVQAFLLDLAGRPSYNLDGNYVTLGKVVALSRMMGLHLDCSGWRLPVWERDLRQRLWWNVLQHDKWSSLCYGRPSFIQLDDWDVKSLTYEEDSDASFQSYACFSELTTILDNFLRQFFSIRKPRLRSQNEIYFVMTEISSYATQLDKWKALLPPAIQQGFSMSSHTSLSPGICSVVLAYHALTILLCRTALDAVSDIASSDEALKITAHSNALMCAQEMVNYVVELHDSNIVGYWSNYSAFHLSTLSVLLLRLIMFDKPNVQPANDSSPNSSIRSSENQNYGQNIAKVARNELKKLFNKLSDVHSRLKWDIAELTLRRIRYMVPLLSKQVPELSDIFSNDNIQNDFKVEPSMLMSNDVWTTSWLDMALLGHDPIFYNTSF